jgi:selenide,water dikinase
VNDKEVKYGLAVVGMIDPNRIISNEGAMPGDCLVLTKPIGTGVLATAHKNGKLDDEGIARLVGVMTQLNREASEKMLEHDAHACTDITGFGLLGHAGNMARESDVTLEILAADVPLMEGAIDAVRDGQVTAGGGTNRKFVNDVLEIDAGVDEDVRHLLFDPQTAGGLLIAVSEEAADALLESLRPNHPQAAIVGQCRSRGDATLIVR